MKKIQLLAIAILCSTFLWTACSKKMIDNNTNAATKTVVDTPQEAPLIEKPIETGRKPTAPAEESLSKNAKGIGVQAQAIDNALPEEILNVQPIPEVQMPPLSKEEEEALRKRILDAQAKQKKKKG